MGQRFFNTQVAASVPYDPTLTGLPNTVQGAIDALSQSAKFPRRTILAAEVFTILAKECMVTYQELEIEDTGELVIEGESVIIE